MIKNQAVSENMILVTAKMVWNYRKFLIGINLVVLIVSVVILLMLPNEYKASMLVSLRDEENSIKIPSILNELPGGLSGFMGGSQGLPIETLIRYSQSRSVLDSLISALDLKSYYRAKYRDDLYQTLMKDLRVTDNEDGTFAISYIHQDPKEAQRAIKIVFDMLSDLIIRVETEQARQYKVFLQKRYRESNAALNDAEEALKVFGERTGIINLEEQIQGQIKVLSELEEQKIQAELEYDLLKTNVELGNSLLKSAQKKVKVIQEKINAYYADNNYSNIPVSKIPEQALDYLRLFREVKIQESIIEVLVPQLEKAKLDEKKDYVSLVVIDPPLTAEKKARPKRASILILVQLMTVILSLVIARGFEVIQKMWPEFREYIKK